MNEEVEIKFLCIIAAPEGIKVIETNHPDVQIYCAVVDEGLNEMDSNLERRIMKNIFNHYSDKTFIIISHRNDNMDLFDRVLWLEDGIISKDLRK